MKRQKRKAKPAKKAPVQTAGAASPAQSGRDRRRFLRALRSWGVAAVVLAAGGWYLYSSVGDSLEEQDLSRIGNGVPSVVQIHDPQCRECLALEREARAALTEFEDGQLQYLVANIRQPLGRRFASTHGVSHVTIVLFDGEGRRRDVLVGPNTSDGLAQAFRRLLDDRRRG